MLHKVKNTAYIFGQVTHYNWCKNTRDGPKSVCDSQKCTWKKRTQKEIYNYCNKSEACIDNLMDRLMDMSFSTKLFSLLSYNPDEN